MASLGLNSWPRMRSGFENPFQNAPGRFIPALPNLAGPCRSMFSDAISDCSFACPFAPFDDENYRRQSRYCRNPPEAPPVSPVETVETAGPLTEDADPEDLPLDDDNDSDSDDTSSSQHPQEQQSSSGSSTLTPSHSHTPSSPTSSESFEDEDEDAEGSPKVKERRKRRSGQGARRRRRNRQLAQQNGCVMGPRAMGIPGVQIQVWLQRSQPQPQSHQAHSHSQQLAPPWLPSAMPGVGHAHVLFPAPAYRGFAVGAGSSSPTTWLLPPSSHAAPPIPGFFVG